MRWQTLPVDNGRRTTTEWWKRDVLHFLDMLCTAGRRTTMSQRQPARVAQQTCGLQHPQWSFFVVDTLIVYFNFY